MACPARGTTLLSDNLDVFLSGLLSLTGKLVGTVTGPGGSLVFSAFKRIALEIAHKRVNARLVPGIEAMLTDSPLGTLLAHAPRKQGVQMAVIAGDIEGGGGLKRLGVMFTDWMLFDSQDNDLVVNTRSMYGGLAGQDDARALFDQGEEVNHFRYFRNTRTRTALRDWLVGDAPETLPAFEPVQIQREPTLAEAKQRAAAGPRGPQRRPRTLGPSSSSCPASWARTWSCAAATASGLTSWIS